MKTSTTSRSVRDRPEPARVAIVVVGMHRSGTSAVTRVLSLLGAALPKNLLGAGKGNEEGHWEPSRLVVAHDLNPLLPVLTDAVYLLDGHPHHDEIGHVVQEELLTHLYGTPVGVVRTAQGDLFTRAAWRETDA